MLKVKELREKGMEELQEMQRALVQEVFHLRGKRRDTKAVKPHVIGMKRKEVARILTILEEKRRGNGAQ